MQGALEARRLAEAAASARRARADRVALVLLVILLLAGCAVGGFYGARYLHDRLNRDSVPTRNSIPVRTLETPVLRIDLPGLPRISGTTLEGPEFAAAEQLWTAENGDLTLTLAQADLSIPTAAPGFDVAALYDFVARGLAERGTLIASEPVKVGGNLGRRLEVARVSGAHFYATLVLHRSTLVIISAGDSTSHPPPEYLAAVASLRWAT